ncbi:MAG: dihydroorotase [Deltaproteobacteria bacterium]|nr:dihydroorotase [Deltaproteobacteria bacterium]
MTDLFIANGRVVDPARTVDTRQNVLVRGGRIAEFTAAKTPPAGVPVFDARGAVVAPGFIDIHTHLRDPGQEYQEDIASGMAAAAAGGFTAVVCMANTNPVNDTAAVTRYILSRAHEVGRVRCYPVGAITRGLTGETLADIGDMAAHGIVAVSDDGQTITDTQVMRRGMEYATTFGLPVIVHCEDTFLCDGTAMHEGIVATTLGLRGRPAESEEIIVRRDIALARLTGARLHVAHVSAAESVDAIRAAHAAKLRVTAEVTPHHLLLTDAAVGAYDTNAKVNPPLRDERHRAALRQALRDGVFSAIATDHAPHNVIEKEVPFEEAACGMIGLESAFALSCRLVEERVLPFPRLIALLTIGPATALGLPGGTMAIGQPADITIVDPKAPVTIRTDRMCSKSRNSPFHGWKCRGAVRATIVGGRVVYQSS